jgi:hypothetical protein
LCQAAQRSGQLHSTCLAVCSIAAVADSVRWDTGPVCML